MRASLAVLIGMGLTTALAAGEWPQILGPARNGAAEKEKLPAAWPAGGPRVLWKGEVGAGYGGPAVAAGRVVVFHRLGDQERVEAFDLMSGKSLWGADFEATYRGGIDADLGPRCVPTIHDGRVYAFGAGGDLHCVRLEDGGKVWSRALAADYDAPDGYFGAGSSPIVAGQRLWVNLGGREAGLVALDLATGKTLYRGTTEQASYSSPTLATIGGRESLVFVTRYNCLGIDPASGAERFSFEFGKRGPTVNAATPLVFGDRLFVSASYGVGARLMRFANGAPTVVWENDESMSSQYTTCVHHQGYLYGAAGREDVGDASLRCIDAATGAVKWDVEGYGIAHVILAGDQLLVVRQRGEIALAPATPARFAPTATATITRGNLRPLPALAEGKLVVRTVASGGRGELLCVDVGAQAP
jgi:outer membrane protein assembly factor BamB